MGLDWMLNKSKPKPGFEERYVTVSRMLSQMREGGEAESPRNPHQLRASARRRSIRGAVCPSGVVKAFL